MTNIGSRMDKGLVEALTWRIEALREAIIDALAFDSREAMIKILNNGLSVDYDNAKACAALSSHTDGSERERALEEAAQMLNRRKLSFCTFDEAIEAIRALKSPPDEAKSTEEKP